MFVYMYVSVYGYVLIVHDLIRKNRDRDRTNGKLFLIPIIVISDARTLINTSGNVA